MNNVSIIGRVGQQPELRHTSTGTPVCDITIAVDGRNDEPEWIPVVTWGATAEAVAAHVDTGRQVAVEGELRVKVWESDDGHKHRDIAVHARRVDFLAKPRTTVDANTTEPVAATV